MNKTIEKSRLRWLKIKPAHFGSLDKEIIFDPAKLNLVIGKNEAGKSTLVASIMAGLYNVASRATKSDPRPLKKQYKPWEKKTDYGLDFEIEWNNRKLLISRDFEKATLTVEDAGKGDITREFLAARNEDRLGEVITGGLSPSSFLRSFLIRQEEASILSKPEDLVERIQKIISSSPGDISTRKAIDLIYSSLENVETDGLFKGKVRADSALKRLNENREKLQLELSAIENKLIEAQRTRSEHDESLVRRQRMLDDLNKIKKGVLEQELNELKNRIQNANDAERQVEHLNEELNTLDDVKSFPLDLEKHFDETFAKQSEAAENVKQISKELNKRLEEYDREKASLETFGDMAELDKSEAQSLHNDLLDWSNKNKILEKSMIKLDEQKEALAAQGIFSKRLEKVKNALNKWPEDVAENFKAKKAEFDVAEKKKNDAEEAFNRYHLELKAQPLSPAVFLIILLAIVGASGAAIEWKVLENLTRALWIIGIATFSSLAYIIYDLSHFVSERIYYKRKRDNSRREFVEIEKSFKSYTSFLGDENPSEIETIISDMDKLADEDNQYFITSNEVEKNKQNLDDVGKLITPMLEAAGAIEPGEKPTPGEVVGSTVRLEHYLNRLEELAKLEIKIESAREESRRASERMETLWNELLSICNSASVPLEENAEASAKIFHTRAAKAHKRIEIIEKLNLLEKDKGDVEAVKKCEERVRIISEEIKNFGDIESYSGSAIDLREREEKLYKELKDLEREISDNRLHLIKFLEELPQQRRDLQNELKIVESKIKSLTLQKNAAELAVSTIEEVEHDVFGNAANLLNKQLVPLLEKLLPRWSSATFDEDLILSASDSTTGKKLRHLELEQTLSSGARDALYLGARMALSDYLTDGLVEAPHLLDEPYAHLDDERFILGMKLLIEKVVEGRQVIVMTCHEGRHRDWLENLDESERNLINKIELEGIQ